jgi:hypothetical protein
MINLQIQEADFAFVIEALRARADGLMATLIAQAQAQVSTPAASEPVKETATAPVAAPRRKKAPKVSVIRLNALEKALEAPYGYKKDGTPRGKPGRKAA